MKVLLVDDNLTITKALSKSLKREDNKVETAENGEEAITKYEKFKPDVTILDISMPNMDGFEALTKILQMDNDATVIMASAAGSSEQIAKCMRKGALGFIEKPYNYKELISTIKKLVRSETENDRIFSFYSRIATKMESSLRKITNDSLSVTLKKVDFGLEKQIHLPDDSVGIITKVDGDRNGTIASILNKQFLHDVIELQNESLKSEEESAFIYELFNVLHHNLVNEFENYSGLKLTIEPPRFFDEEKDSSVTTREFIKIGFDISWKDSQTGLELYQCLN